MCKEVYPDGYPFKTFYNKSKKWEEPKKSSTLLKKRRKKKSTAKGNNLIPKKKIKENTEVRNMTYEANFKERKM